MCDSTNTSHRTYATIYVKTKSKRKTRGATMFTKVIKAHENDVCFPINLCPRAGNAYGEHADNFRGYMSVQCRSKVSILIDN